MKIKSTTLLHFYDKNKYPYGCFSFSITIEKLFYNYKTVFLQLWKNYSTIIEIEKDAVSSIYLPRCAVRFFSLFTKRGKDTKSENKI